jgi:SAM-dependent methyltransferase
LHLSLNKMKIYKFLENPFWYNLIIRLFSFFKRTDNLNSFLDLIFSKECKGCVLEIGSGTCQFNALYEKWLPRYFATDINVDYLKYAKETTENTIFIVSDSQLLPFNPYSFDSIFALFMFHHLSDECVQLTLQEIDLCLKNGGTFIVMDVFLPDKWFDLTAFIAGKIDRGRHVRKRSHFLSLCAQKNLFQWREIAFKESWPYDMSAFIFKKAKS